jgi:hypothetical protein
MLTRGLNFSKDKDLDTQYGIHFLGVCSKVVVGDFRLEMACLILHKTQQKFCGMCLFI